MHVPRSIRSLCLLAVGLAACDGTAPPRVADSAPPAGGARAVSEATKSALVGLWDDGLVGENTKLDLRADGSAHIVSHAVRPAAWTFDADTLQVTITSRRQADGSTVRQHVTFDRGADVLTGRFSGPNGREHVFRRASQEAIDWWAGVRPRVEAADAGGR